VYFTCEVIENVDECVEVAARVGAFDEDIRGIPRVRLHLDAHPVAHLVLAARPLVPVPAANHADQHD